LDTPFRVLEVGKGTFAHSPDGHEAPGHGNLIIFPVLTGLDILIIGGNVVGMMGLQENSRGVGINSLFPEGFQFFEADFDEFIEFGQETFLTKMVECAEAGESSWIRQLKFQKKLNALRSKVFQLLRSSPNPVSLFEIK
jgi:hypothetical protein